jgi:FAD-dependent urate hydroxylase
MPKVASTAGEFAKLKLVPTEAWAQYLDWYEKVLELEVRAETEAGPIEWLEAERCFAVPLTTRNEHSHLLARRVILATGIEGSGAWTVPAFIANALPKARYAHTSENIDFDALRGKRVGVLGAGSSAYDNALYALERGAKVDLFFRRKEMPRTKSPFYWGEFAGFMMQYARLADHEKYRFMRLFAEMGQPATASTAEAMSYPTFTLRSGEGWESVEDGPDGVTVKSNKASHQFDFLILGTGYVTDLSKRAIYDRIRGDIAIWRDKFESSTSDAIDRELLNHPYLGPNFEHVARVPGTAAHVAYVFNYTFGGLVSNGLPGGSIAGLRYSVDRLVAGVVGSIFDEDKELLWEDLVATSRTPIYPKICP